MGGFLHSLKGTKDELTQKVKGYLANEEEQLKKVHRAVKIQLPGMSITRAYTSIIDELIKGLFLTISNEIPLNDTASLIALGGYGRGELNIRSDVDLMLLYNRKITPDIETFTDRLLYILWDIGMDVGFSTRSIAECIELGKTDAKTKTSFLDVRPLLGNVSLYDELSRKIRKTLFTGRPLKRFVEEKIEEKKARHEKYGGSIYILEPNVKEGEGGLRDVHTARWISSAMMETGELLGEAEKTTLYSSIDFIHWTRNELHFETKRKKDQLTFDHQERIAAILGFKDADAELAVESFMRSYYTHADNVKNISNIMISRCIKEKKGGIFQRKLVIDDDYAVTGGLVSVLKDDVFKKDPWAVIKAFEYAQSHKTSIDQPTKDLILKTVADIDCELSEEGRGSFMRILGGRDVYGILLEMQRLGALEKIIPEFSSITCKVQHDLYHVYTVDAHSLFAVMELDKLKDAYKKEFPLLAKIFEELENQDVLVLSLLLHDIGKSMGKGHAEKGAELIPQICKRLGLGEEAMQLCEFLVRNHLILADTAQYRDLHDDMLIVEFAKKIGTVERLKMLYLITFADVRAVGPDVWNEWKGALFQELYFNALGVLERGIFEPEDADIKIRRIRDTVKDRFRKEISEEDIDDYFNLLPPRYFLSTRPDAIAEHINLVKRLAGGLPCIMTVKQMSERNYTEIAFITHDIHGLFSMMTGVLAANSVNILGAEINTLKNGIALDILQVTNAFGGLLTDEPKLKRLEEDFSNVITGKIKVEKLTEKIKPSILDKKIKPRVATRIKVDNVVSSAFTVIDIHTQDRLGLLYKISSTVTRLGLYIYIAKISTKGDEAADVFYVKDIFGQKIFDSVMLENIEKTLYDVLG